MAGKRTFSGSRYFLICRKKLKSDAQFVAKRYRNGGAKARVVKLSSGYGVYSTSQIKK
jgi:hypothetical protein